MPTYLYAGRSATGRQIQGSLEADSEGAAVKILQSQDILVTQLRDASVRSGNKSKKRKFRRKKAGGGDLVLFANQLATLLSAGIPLVRAIGIIQAQTESEKFYKTLDEIMRDLRSGLALKSALEKHGDVIPSLWIYLIEAGEVSGNLVPVLQRLAAHLEATQNLKRKVVTALFYPIILSFIAAIAILIFLLVIVPKFAAVFAQFNSKLPPLTEAVIFLSRGFAHYFIYIFFFAALLFYFIKAFLKTPAGKRFKDRLLLRLPFFGKFVANITMARITINLSTLIKSGINIIQALEITAKASGNIVYEDALHNVSRQVQQGKPLSSVLNENPIFGVLFVQLVGVGEESGTLADMIERVSKSHQEKTDVFIARLGVLVEPVLILFVGGVIFIMAIAMFLPLVNMSTAIHG